MRVLVVGASGETGRLLVEKLLHCEHEVKIIVRSKDKLSEFIKKHKKISIITANILDLSDDDLVTHVKDCNAIASCLGHNLSLKGMYGKPRRLVLDATKRLCHAIKINKPTSRVKYILMNTAGNSNRDLSEKISFSEKCVIGLLRLLLPPLVDNEEAADFLRTYIAQKDNDIEWVAVRPDSLKDETEVTPYEIHPSPIRSALFDPGAVSRVNVASFMAKLITDEKVWGKWKGQMPVIYKKEKI